MDNLLDDPRVTRRELEEVDALYKRLIAAVGNAHDRAMVMSAVQLFTEQVLAWCEVTLDQFVTAINEQRKERPRG